MRQLPVSAAFGRWGRFANDSGKLHRWPANVSLLFTGAGIRTGTGGRGIIPPSPTHNVISRVSEYGIRIFCIQDANLGTPDVEPERILKSYEHWWLILHQPKKRAALVQAAGMLVLKRHAPGASECSAEEFGELPGILHDASGLLCSEVGAEYTQQTRLGFNEGREAGQTLEHVHLHLLPVSESDRAALKVRGGIGGAFEALRTLRLEQ